MNRMSQQECHKNSTIFYTRWDKREKKPRPLDSCSVSPLQKPSVTNNTHSLEKKPLNHFSATQTDEHSCNAKSRSKTDLISKSTSSFHFPEKKEENQRVTEKVYKHSMIISASSSQEDIDLVHRHDHRNSLNLPSFKNSSHHLNKHHHELNPKGPTSLSYIKKPTKIVLNTDSPKSSNYLSSFHKDSISTRQKRRSLKIVDSASDEETEPPVKKIASTSSPSLCKNSFSSNIFLDVIIPKKKESKFASNASSSVTQHNDTLQKRSLEKDVEDKLASSFTDLIPRKKNVRTVTQEECRSHSEKHLPILSQEKKLATLSPNEKQVLVETISLGTPLVKETREKKIHEESELEDKLRSVILNDKEDVDKKIWDATEKKKNSPVKQGAATGSKFSRELCSLYEDLIESGASQLLLQKSSKRHRDSRKPHEKQASSHAVTNSCSKTNYDTPSKGNEASKLTPHVKKQFSTLTKPFQVSKNSTLTLTKSNKASGKPTVAKAMDSIKAMKPREANGLKPKQLTKKETIPHSSEHTLLLPLTPETSLALNPRIKKNDTISSTIVTPQRNKSCCSKSSDSMTHLKNYTAVKSFQTVDCDVPPTSGSSFKRTRKHVVLIHSQFLIQRLVSHPIETTPILLPTKI